MHRNPSIPTIFPPIPRSLRDGTGVLVLAVTLLGPTGCGEPSLQPNPVEPGMAETLAPAQTEFGIEWKGPRETRDYSSEVARAWFDLSYNLVKTERWSPPVASRFWGYAGVTLYEATRHGMPGYESLQGQLQGLHDVPPAHGSAYHWPAVANAALHTIFSGLFSAATQPSLAQIHALYELYAGQFAQELPPGILRRSERFGQEVGGAIIEWSNGDGYAAVNNCAYTPPVGEGFWEPTPPGFGPPLQPCWGELRTCVVGEGAACDPGPHPPYSTKPGSDFYNEGLEVYETVANLTDEQLAIALFWADTPGQTGTPSGHWISILGQVLGENGFALDVAAEAYAKVGLAEMDAFICCWFVKYEFNLLRPITYIRDLIDPAWNSPIPTPPFPEYTSGHSTQSAAVAQVLTDMLGDLPFTDHTHDDLGYAPRSFLSFWEAAEEAAISRLYGGIHYRAAIEKGLDQGRCIGEAVSALSFGPGAL